MTIFIGSDHAGYEYKEYIKEALLKEGHEIRDFGTEDASSTDYPDYVHPLAKAMEKDSNAVGIVICGSGNGVAMTANKHQHIRAGLCWNKELTALARQHNNANVIAIPARFVSKELAMGMVEVFLNETFEGGRHARRVGKIACG